LQKILPAPFQDRTAECRPVPPRGALRKEKRKNNKSRKVGKAQRPPEVKLSAPQFLCVSAPAYRRQGFARVKKKYFAREAAKTLRPSAGKNFRSLILETSLPRRLGVVHNFFAPTSAGRPAYRRQVFVRKKEKIIRRPVILRGRLQSREGAKSVRLSAAGRP